MTMVFLRKHTDPIDELANTLRQAYRQLRDDAFAARRAAAVHKSAATQQLDTALAVTPEEDDDA